MSRLVTTALVLLATTGVATELPEGGSSRKQKQVRIAGIVLKWIRTDEEANLRRAEALIREAAAGGAQIVCTTECSLELCPSGGMFGPKSNDPILQARSRETHLPIVFVHPAEFLVTGPDGSILDRTILGNSLLIAPAEIGTPKDQNKIFYYDLPGASDKAAGHTLGDGAVVRDVWAGHFDLLKVRIQQSREAIAASLRQPGARPVTVAVTEK